MEKEIEVNSEWIERETKIFEKRMNEEDMERKGGTERQRNRQNRKYFKEGKIMELNNWIRTPWKAIKRIVFLDRREDKTRRSTLVRDKIEKQGMSERDRKIENLIKKKEKLESKTAINIKRNRGGKKMGGRENQEQNTKEIEREKYKRIKPLLCSRTVQDEIQDISNGEKIGKRKYKVIGGERERLKEKRKFRKRQRKKRIRDRESQRK